MSTIIESLSRTFTATVTVDQYSVVAVDLTKVKLATVTDDQVIVGTALEAADQGNALRVQLANSGGTTYGICAVTISAGDDVYTAAGGKVSTVTADSTKYGTALETGIDGAVIEILLA